MRYVGKKKSCSTLSVSLSMALRGQPFDFLIVLDFEATCWEDEPENSKAEIIEFPAVLFDVAKRSIVGDSYRTLVRPTERPLLSEF